MRCHVFAPRLAFLLLGMTALASAQFELAAAHEGHHAKCTETAMNAVAADIQAMKDGKAKTKAREELGMAREMMAKGDLEGCTAHVHSAMEAVEE
jgi:hypothetical protein